MGLVSLDTGVERVGGPVRLNRGGAAFEYLLKVRGVADAGEKEGKNDRYSTSHGLQMLKIGKTLQGGLSLAFAAPQVGIVFVQPIMPDW